MAHRKKWSLETLHLRLDLEQIQDPEAFILDGMQNQIHVTCLLSSTLLLGLVLEGATFSGSRLSLNDGETTRLGPSQLRWVQVQSDLDDEKGALVNLPVYLNVDRSDVLFTVKLAFSNSDTNLVAMRAVCLTAGG